MACRNGFGLVFRVRALAPGMLHAILVRGTRVGV